MRSSHTVRTARPDSLGTTRTVTIRLWVSRDQIEQGMYVVELDRPWIETPFLFQGFPIDSPETLAAVREACEQALVETEKVVPVRSGDYQKRADVSWPTGAHSL